MLQHWVSPLLSVVCDGYELNWQWSIFGILVNLRNRTRKRWLSISFVDKSKETMKGFFFFFNVVICWFVFIYFVLPVLCCLRCYLEGLLYSRSSTCSCSCSTRSVYCLVAWCLPPVSRSQRSALLLCCYATFPDACMCRFDRVSFALRRRPTGGNWR